MKKIADVLSGLGADVKKYYCSSDTRSLDGIIIKRDGKSCAIIDGTAPHTFDPQMPGAVDEIVNLAEAFDQNQLSAESDRICELVKHKRLSYEKTYSYLGISSVYWGKIKAEIKSNYEYHLAISYFSEWIDNAFECENGEFDISLISSFSNNGLSLPCSFSKNVMTFEGCEKSITLGVLHKILSMRKIKHTVFFNALDGDTIDAIDCPALSLSVDDCLSDAMTVPCFCRTSILDSERDFLYCGMNSALDISSSYLRSAFEQHSQLEKIYTAAVDFKKVDRIREELIEKIIFYLSAQ
jgi:hypothetical protein